MSNGFLVPTGYIIKDYLEEIDVSQKELATRMGMSEKHISNVLSGKSKLTEEFSIKIEKIIHAVPASYWLNYEAKYREYVARENINEELDKQDLKSLNKRFNFTELFSGMGLNMKEQANEMLKLLQISSFEQFDKVYANINVDFMEDGGEKEPIAIWLNLAREEVDIQNKDLSDKKYKKEVLVESLTKFKKIALNPDYHKSLLSARKLLNQIGIYLVICDAVRNSKVRGALITYKKNPAIFLSGRFKTHDHIWFALMHEIGHLINHYSPGELFVSLESENIDDLSEREMVANQFARDFFIDKLAYKQFINSVHTEFTEENMIEFARSQKVNTGIVLARLQHDGYVDFDKFNHFKNR